jgi:cell division protein FtsL
MIESDIIEENDAETSATGTAEAQSEADGSVPKRLKRVQRSRPAWKRMFSYRWIVKNIPYFLFLAVLAVIYIYNGHYADKTIRQVTRVNKELKELQYEYKTIKSEVMFRSKQSELAKAVEPFGLKELLQPPIVIGDSTRDDKK